MKKFNVRLYRFKHWLRFTLWWWLGVTWNRYVNSKAICTECKHTNAFHRWNDGEYCAHTVCGQNGEEYFCDCGERMGR